MDCPGARADCTGLTNTLEEELGSGSASEERILEQGLALDELVEMKTSTERGAQGESGGDQSPPAEGAAGGLLYHHRQIFPMMKA